MKYERKNDNFEHKFILFHHFCNKTDLFHEMKSKTLFFMLKSFALDYYLVNVNMLKNVTLNQTCIFINIHFENLDFRQNNLQKWNQITLKSMMIKLENQNKFTLNCLKIFINDLRHMQHGFAFNLQNENFMQNHLIITCENVLACRFACYKPNLTLTGQIIDLQIFISTYEKIHLNHQIEIYQAENYFTDRRFHDRQFASKSRSRYLNLSPDRFSRNNRDSNRSFIPYDRDRERKKRCFICDKKDCWSTNHIREKRDAAWTRLKERYIKRDRFDDDDQRIFQYMTDYIVDYEDYDLDVDLIDEMNVYSMNFMISAFKFSFFHSFAFTKPDNSAINYYHDDVVTGSKISDRYDYAYY